ncbi:MAG: HemK2/MTQ2 family protein methyltransferase [Thermoplasmata archaeon]
MEISEDITIRDREGVYSPDDDTYMLLDLVQVEPDEDVLEIGCGSGIISLHCAEKGASVTASDIDPSALELTMENAELNGIELEGILLSDLFENVVGTWEVIVFNPPYLPIDDRIKADRRWDGGKGGDETILRFLNDAADHIHPDGRIYFCCSDMSPLTEIYKTIDDLYEIIEQKTKDYRFETLYCFSLAPAFEYVDMY